MHLCQHMPTNSPGLTGQVLVNPQSFNGFVGLAVVLANRASKKARVFKTKVALKKN